MKPLLSALLLFAAAAWAARAADAPKPNTLTPTEVADGWLLLFDGETTFGWRSEGDVTVADGTLVIGGEREGQVTFAALPLALELQFDARSEDVFAQVRIGPEAMAGGFGLMESAGKWAHYSFTAKYDPASKILSVDSAGWKSTLRPNDKDRLIPAIFAVRFKSFTAKRFSVKNVKVRPINLKPIFNGKDLSGWKKYTADGKRVKTDFTVTKEGWLHLKNGPGDLQTEGRYDDFVLQVECKTNGKNLNSGVFFRCIPGDYQNGYEAQVHNGFADSPKEYAVEQYDPKTNELKDKTKVKSAALDYGTGAIYRRVPARKQAAKDGEWFTMTVVAQGRHVATWVNGVQMVDWTDNRPAQDNPRNGCRLEKGAISLQGHDPTTDIDFRNIRIAELPKAEK